jgi:CRP/FNR family transcriptional regulator
MLQPLSRQKLDLFFTQYTHRYFKKRETIINSEELKTHIYYIKNGFIRAYRISEEGEELTLLILKPDDFFPLTYGLNNMPNIYYLEAITPIEVFRAPQEPFLQFLHREPEVFFDLSTQVMDRFDGLLARMEYMIWSKAYTKIAATLLICARRFGKPSNNSVLIDVPLTHRDIATIVGLTRETTSIEMKKLENKGLLTKRGRLLFIPDLEKLEQESLLNHQEELLQNHFI